MATHKQKRRRPAEIPPEEHAANKAYGRRYKERRRRLLASNPDCALRLPGCTGTATQADHYDRPVSKGGKWHDELVPACSSCNSRKGDRSLAEVEAMRREPNPRHPSARAA